MAEGRFAREARSRRASLLWSVAFCTALAGCGGAAADAPDSTDDALVMEALASGGTGHVLPLREGGVPPAAAPAAHLSYYGGRVLEKAEVVAVFWGDGVDAGLRSAAAPFYAAALGGTYVSWLSEYDTTVKAVDGSAGTGQHIGTGMFKQAVAIAPKSKATRLTDAAVRKELTAQLSAGKLPAPGPNTLYMIHFPAGVQIEMGGQSSCTAGGFCAYHDSFKRRGKEVDYAVLPDLGPGSGCDTGCGNGKSPLANETAVASHELVEAITDPGVGLGSGLSAPLAWYDAKNGEIGDICDGKTGTLHGKTGATFTVQKEWSNRARACVTSGASRNGASDGDDDAWEE